MTTAQIIWTVIHILLGILLLVACRKTRTPFKNLLICSGLGLLSLLAVAFTAGYTGVKLGFTPYTVATSAVLGMPGVILLLVLNLLMG